MTSGVPEPATMRFRKGFSAIPGGCWEWQGALARSGYGVLKVGGRTVTTHRFSWESHRGPIPEGMFVCHTCDNRKCVNPDHLFLGTCADNQADMARKGRARNNPSFGEAHHGAVLTEADIKEIRRLRAAGMSQREIGARFGMKQGHISDILRGKVWSHVR